MVTQLAEEQWELSDGFGNSYLFGAGTGVRVLKGGLDYGSSEVRSQTVARAQGDGGLFGRDFKTGPEWSITVGVLHGLDVWQVLYPFQAAWDAVKVRSQAGALATLRYRRNGQTYRLLGRPQKSGIVQADQKHDDFQQVLCTFQLANPEVYLEPADASTRTLRLDLVAAPSDGGIVFGPDLSWPIELRPSSQARVGEVVVGGYRPAPFRVQVFGPVQGVASQIKVSGDGWQIVTSATVTAGQSLVIDTAANTITRQGVSVAGTLSRASRLTSRLAVGHQFITFDAVDPSNTAYAVVTWLDTLPA